MKNELSDPIVEEVRQHGVEYAAGLDFDLDRIVLDLQLRQDQRGRKVVSFSREDSVEVETPELGRRGSR